MGGTSEPEGLKFYFGIQDWVRKGQGFIDGVYLKDQKKQGDKRRHKDLI